MAAQQFTLQLFKILASDAKARDSSAMVGFWQSKGNNQVNYEFMINYWLIDDWFMNI